MTGPIFNARRARSPVFSGVTSGPQTGFVENTAAAFEAMRKTGLSISRSLNTHEAYGDYVTEIFEATGVRLDNPLLVETPPGSQSDPSIINAIRQKALDEFHAKADELAAGQGGFRARSPADILAGITEAAQDAEFDAAEIGSRAGALGLLGQFAGGAGGAFTDPIVFASLFLGASASAGVLRTAATESAIGAGSEALIQPAVQDYRAEIGLEHGFDQAFRNILFAAGGGGIFGGGLRLLGKGRAKIQEISARSNADLAAGVEKEIPDPSPEVRAARDNLEEVAAIDAENVLEETPEAAREFVERADAAVEAARRGELPDDPDFVKVRIEGTEDSPDLDLFDTPAGRGQQDQVAALEAELLDSPDAEVPLGGDLQADGSVSARVATRQEIFDELDIDAGFLRELEAC